MFPVGATSENKVFVPEVLEPIIQWVSHRGYTPVITGSSKSYISAETPKGLEPLPVLDNFDNIGKHTKGICHDLRDATTLIQLRDLCGHASAVVGIDGGTLHLAATTEVPIVYGLTSVARQHRSIVRDDEWNWRLRHVTPHKLDCAGCQSNMTLMFNHDFRFCLYKDNACTTALRSGDFIAALESLGL